MQMALLVIAILVSLKSTLFAMCNLYVRMCFVVGSFNVIPKLIDPLSVPNRRRASNGSMRVDEDTRNGRDSNMSSISKKKRKQERTAQSTTAQWAQA